MFTPGTSIQDCFSIDSHTDSSELLVPKKVMRKKTQKLKEKSAQSGVGEGNLNEPTGKGLRMHLPCRLPFSVEKML